MIWKCDQLSSLGSSSEREIYLQEIYWKVLSSLTPKVSEGSRIKQREELNYNAIETKSSGAGLALQHSLKVGQGGWDIMPLHHSFIACELSQEEAMILGEVLIG